MQTILPEFMGSMQRILNNFHLSFLSFRFLNLRPFSSDIVLPVDMPLRVISAQSINSLGDDAIQEYANSIRRHFLHDMYNAYERYSTFMMASHSNRQCRIDPSLICDKKLGASRFEQLVGVYQVPERKFLIQLRHFRNSVVHYNGVYSATNNLDYTFGSETYSSVGREGQSISVNFNTLLWIYDRLVHVVGDGNSRYFVCYPVV